SVAPRIARAEHAPTGAPQPAAEEERDRPAVEPVLLLEDAGRERRGRVVVLDRHHRLQDDRSALDPLVDATDRAAAHPTAELERRLLHLEAGEGRQERWVDIEDPPGETGDEPGGEKAHVPREADEPHAARVERLPHPPVVLIARGALAVIDDHDFAAAGA